MSKSLCESRPLVVTEADSSSGTIPVVLIDAGWGSSGYYSETVLKNAAKSGVFPAGLQMFLDHPGEQESYDRPERSVRDLAATLATAGKFEESGKRIVAEAKPMGAHADMLGDKDFLKAVGLSIRAFGDATIGEAEGRKGQIITELTEAISVDFVTRAGRGGKVLVDLMESARPTQVVERAIAHGVQEATANETRTAIQDALQASYGGEKSYAWVRDFDETNVWFQYETPDGSGTYQDSYSMDDNGGATLGGSPVEVRAHTKYVPVKAAEALAVAGNLSPESAAETAARAIEAFKLSAPAEEHKEANMANVEIEESELTRLRERDQRVQTAESERDTAQRELALERARSTARGIISSEATTASVSFTDLEIEGLVGRVSLGDGNTFDEAAFRESVKAIATKRAEESVASAGSGIRGFGSFVDSTQSEADKDVVERAEAARKSAFGHVVKGA